MKKFLTFILPLFFLYCSAEDIIVLNNGDVIRAKVLEILPQEVKYKKATNPDGPTYTIEKSTILSISYENGEKESFKSTAESNLTSNTPSSNQNHEIAPNNLNLINQYNTSTIKHKTSVPNSKKLKTTNTAIINFGITPESILADNNVEIHIERSDEWHSTDNGVYFGDSSKKYRKVPYVPNYKISVINKTDGMIYIDLTKSFRDGSEPFYNGINESHTSNGGSGAALNLGAVTGALGMGGALGTLASGVNVGGGKSNSTTISQAEQTILTIPPKVAGTLPAKKYLNSKKNKVTENYEIFGCPDGLYELADNKGIEKWKYIEGDSVNKSFPTKYTITYYTSENQQTPFTISFGVYARGYLGVDSGFFSIDTYDIISENGPNFFSGVRILTEESREMLLQLKRQYKLQE